MSTSFEFRCIRQSGECAGMVWESEPRGSGEDICVTVPSLVFPLWVIQTDKWLAPRWVHLLLCLFSVHLILCAFHIAAYSLLIDRGSREIFGIPGKNKLILLGALLRRMEITGFSQRLAVSLEVSELKTVLYIGLSDGDDCAGRSPRVANVLILQYSPPFLSFSILNNVCVPLTS